MTIRTGQASDLPPVLLLWPASEAEPTHADDAQSLGGPVEHDPSAPIAADDGRPIVGSAIAVGNGWRGSVHLLAVAPSDRRRGLDRRLVREAELRLSAGGARRLQAITVETDPVAAGFREERGWEQQVHRLPFVKGCHCPGGGRLAVGGSGRPRAPSSDRVQQPRPAARGTVVMSAALTVTMLPVPDPWGVTS